MENITKFLPPVKIVAILLTVVGAFAGYMKWTGTVDESLLSLEKSVAEVRTDIKELAVEVRTDIKKILGRLPHQGPVARTSPLRLTDMGEDISEKLKARNWAKEVADSVADRIKGKQPFEIQEFSLNYIENDFKATADQENKFGEIAYNYGLEKEAVLRILVIVLRDELLKREGFESESLP